MKSHEEDAINAQNRPQNTEEMQLIIFADPRTEDDRIVIPDSEVAGTIHLG